LRPALAEPSFATFCGLPAAVCLEGMIPVVSSGNTEVRRFCHEGRGYFLKEFFFLGWKKHLKVLKRGEWLVSIAAQLEEHGFHTPRVVGIGRNGKNRRVVTEAVEDVRDVWQILFPDFQTYRGEVDDGFVYALGCNVGKLHRAGFFHGDLRWRNVLARLDVDCWKFYFIDNDRTRRFRFGIPFRFRVKNLAQVLFSGLLLDWPQRDWKIFLLGYADNSGLSKSILDKLVSSVEKKAKKRLIDRNMRSTS